MRNVLILLAYAFLCLPAQAQLPPEAQGKLLVYAVLYPGEPGRQFIDIRITNYTKQSWQNIVVECDFRREGNTLIQTRRHTFKGPVYDFQYQVTFNKLNVLVAESVATVGCAVAAAEPATRTLIPAR